MTAVSAFLSTPVHLAIAAIYGVLILASAAVLTSGHQDYLPAAKVGTSYAASIIAFGGTPPYHWALHSGSLPPGLVIDAARGVLRGTPTTAGTYFAVATNGIGTATSSAVAWRSAGRGRR